MLIGTKSYTESASAVPVVVARVVVYPVGNSERNTVEEHVTGEVFVGLAGHDHDSVIGGLPVRKNYDIPISVVEVDIVVAVTERAFGTAHLLYNLLNFGLVAGKDYGVCRVSEGFTVLIFHISELD